MEPTVYQLGFSGDHTLYKTPTEWEGWADGDTAIADPVYDADSSKNDPVCLTKNLSTVSLSEVKLKVSPALTYATTIRVDASGTEEWNESQNVSFSGTTSGDASLGITGNIINQVETYAGDFEIAWKYKVPAPGGTNTWYTINTTAHTVYVTYGAPSPGGAELTVQRISKLCEWADGQANRKGVADSINSNLSLPFGDDPSKQSDYWDLMCSACDREGECDEHARFMVTCLDLIGVSGSDAYNTYASEDTEVYNDQDSKIVITSTYWLKFDANGDGIVDNNFEGSVYVPTDDAMTTFHYYTVTPKQDASSDCLLWRKIGPDGWDWKQKWIYAPYGDWTLAWPPAPTQPGNEPYDSCP